MHRTSSLPVSGSQSVQTFVSCITYSGSMAAMHLPSLLLLLAIIGLPLVASQTYNLAANGYDETWQAGHATWYGNPYGDGSDGGACGYKQLTGTPYGASIAAGSGAIFQGGLGCGTCFDVMCTYSVCSSQPTRVVITDLCPGGIYCGAGEVAFDLSGTAMSRMALPGQDGALRNIGQYNIMYKRVPCVYPGQNIAFSVDQGSSGYWLSFTVKYQGGPGDIRSVEVRESGSSNWVQLQHNWGANWMMISYSGQPFNGPFAVRVTSKLNGHVAEIENAIPQYFSPGTTYSSLVQMSY